MGRKTVYTDTQIVQAVYECIRKVGWNKVTVQNVSDQMGCSTQPMYYHYRSLEEMKEKVIGKVKKDFEKCLIEEPLDSNHFFNVALCYIDFAKQEPKLFDGICQVRECGMEIVTQGVHSKLFHSFVDGLDQRLNQKQEECIFQTMLATVFGLSSLRLNITNETMKQKLIDIKIGLEYVELSKLK